MKTFELDDTLKDHPKLKERINALAPVFTDVLGPSEGQVSAHWRLGADEHGRQVIYLKLSDYTHSNGIERGFAPEELANPQRFRSRLLDAWGDLAWAKFQKSVAELQAMTSAEVTL